MARGRRNQPALYELVGRGPRSRGPDGPEPADHPEHAAPPRPEPQPTPTRGSSPSGAPARQTRPARDEPRDPDPAASLLGPGRVVRVPVGYFFFGIAIVVAIGVGGYSLGSFHERQKHEAAAEARVADDLSRVDDPIASDRPINAELLAPTVERAPRGSRSGDEPDRAGAGSEREPTSTGPAATRTGGPGAAQAAGGPGAEAGSAGPIVVGGSVADPRDFGVNYCIVASRGRERALDIARFLVENGVPAAVLPENNQGLSAVVALRGFPSGSFQTPERRSFDRRLRELGETYARRADSDRRDFSDLWWKQRRR